jgi:hypothetical protein
MVWATGAFHYFYDMPFCLVVAESKMIEKHGGYKFTVPEVPTNFNFGGSAPGMN